MEFVAALAGALVGVAAMSYATWWQTKRVLEHEPKQARSAADDEREAARSSSVLADSSDVERAVPSPRPGLRSSAVGAHRGHVTSEPCLNGRPERGEGSAHHHARERRQRRD